MTVRSINLLRNGPSRVTLGAALLMGTLLGLGTAVIAGSTTSTSTARLLVKANTGGIATNSYSDAAVDATTMTEPSTLAAARQALHGNALGDPAALHRVRCGRNPADTMVICHLTGSDARADAAVLRQMIGAFIPLNIKTQVAEFHVMERNLRAQYQEIGVKDRKLRAQMRTLGQRAGKAGLLPQLRAELRQNVNIRGQIVIHEGSVRRQLQRVGSTLRLLRPTPPTFSRSDNLTLGIGMGLGAFMLTLLSVGTRRRRLATQSFRRSMLSLGP